ncbi:MAG: methionyl-tRNA formyltransferase [bacterium]|nr:methionyl-tRNA formyltransferase [bacterium]
MTAPGPVVFFGTPRFAVPCLEVLADSEFRPDLVVSQPSRPAGRGRALRMPPVATQAAELDLYCEQVAKVRSEAFLERLEALRPWIAVVVAFGQIFPRRLLEIPEEGCVNVHASLLPRYRGAAPIQAAIAAGETVTGVTTMRMEKGLDSGPILLEREVEIGDRDMSPDLAAVLSTAGAELLLETLRGLASATLVASPQDEGEVTWAPRLEKSDGYVDWTLPASVLYNRYRAFTPWPGMTASFREEPVKIVECALGEMVASGAEPGTVAERASSLQVVCGDGRALELVSLQRPGRRALSALEFANGERVEVGDRFEAP